jgi:hypothetical protein
LSGRSENRRLSRFEDDVSHLFAPFVGVIKKPLNNP